jgi:hypothetical protein
MNEAEKLKSTLASVFRRKGGGGNYTRLFDDLEPPQKSFLTAKVCLGPDELAIIGSAENNDTWLILTTERIVWGLRGVEQTLSIHDVWHAKADFPKMMVTGTRKHQLRELQIETRDHENRLIEVEAGGPLFGVWNALLNLGARNRQKK